jgi:hypothetical protein
MADNTDAESKQISSEGFQLLRAGAAFDLSYRFRDRGLQTKLIY